MVILATKNTTSPMITPAMAPAGNEEFSESVVRYIPTGAGGGDDGGGGDERASGGGDGGGGGDDVGVGHSDSVELLVHMSPLELQQ